MIIYGLIILVTGAFAYRKLTILKQEMEAEKDEDIKLVLAKSIQRRRLIANILIVFGAVIVLGGAILLASL